VPAVAVVQVIARYVREQLQDLPAPRDGADPRDDLGTDPELGKGLAAGP
jgi:hypothetical protein